jgi:hypothetical protein
MSLFGEKIKSNETVIFTFSTKKGEKRAKKVQGKRHIL